MKINSLFFFLCFTLLCNTSSRLFGQQNNKQLYIQGKEIIQKENTLRIHLLIDAREIRVKKADALELIPELFTSGNLRSFELPKIVLNGQKRQKIHKRQEALGIVYKDESNVYTTIQNEIDPAIIDYDVSIAYEEWMASSSLRVKQALCGCPGEKQLLTENVLIRNILRESEPNPTIHTAESKDEKASLYVSFLEPRKEEVKARSEYGEAYLNFIVNKWDILYDYKDNAPKLNQVQSFFKRAQEDKDIVMNGINIIGYASPEGTYQHNMMLSQNRATSFANWVQSRFSFPHNIYRVDWRGEDWVKLDELVQKSTISEKTQIINIIRNIGIYKGRERELMELSAGVPYKYMLKYMFPQLRRVYYRIDYTVRPFTAAESRKIIDEKPKQMSVFEMYKVAHTYRKGSKSFNNIIRKTVEVFPEDPAAKNNAAAVALQEGRLAEAERLLNETNDSPSSQNNLGVLYMLQGNYTKAKTAFINAREHNVEDAQHNLDVLQKQIELNEEKQLRQQCVEEKQRQAEKERKKKEGIMLKAVPYQIK